jgi:hypothetical protein
LTMQFSELGVMCQKGGRIDKIIQSALDDPKTYKDEIGAKTDYEEGTFYIAERAIEHIIGPEKSSRFPVGDFHGLNPVADRLLTVIRQESDEDFWDHVGKLILFFIRAPNEYNIHADDESVINFIDELMNRCCLVESSETIQRLQQYIIHLIIICDEMDYEKDGSYLKHFKPVFQNAQLSKTAVLQNLIEHNCTTGVIESSLEEWETHNYNLWFNMGKLSCLITCFDVSYLDDVTDPALQQIAVAFDRHNEFI